MHAIASGEHLHMRRLHYIMVAGYTCDPAECFTESEPDGKGVAAAAPLQLEVNLCFRYLYHDCEERATREI
ncbi:hypothetical protein [Paenibacillus sp. FSL H8-0537]|uniref:hypothetical protein n=1 Tax=Paenibacillus sp. FSL H8-0537 TaxID=2921399 RepID=UPI0031017E77